MDFRVIYVGAQTVYGTLFMTLFFLRRFNDSTRRIDKLDALYLVFVLTVILDSIWMFIDGNPALRFGHILLEIVDIAAVAVASYLWFLYTLDYFPDTESLPLYKYRYAIGIPVFIQIVLIITSVWTGLVFTVDEGGVYHRGPIHLGTVVANYVYMLLGSYVALRGRREAVLTMDKRRFGAAALFPVPVLLLSLAQMILPPGLPGIQGGVLVSLLVLYGISQNARVTRDHLTGLPNRFAFEQDLLERIRRRQPGETTHLYLFEGDLNKFKQINDTFGHPVGDVALIDAASALSQVFSAYGAAVFRTGGDEFMAVTEFDEELDVAAINQELNARLASIRRNDNYELSMTLGMQEYDGKMNFREFIEAVDETLYAAKGIAQYASA